MATGVFVLTADPSANNVPHNFSPFHPKFNLTFFFGFTSQKPVSGGIQNAINYDANEPYRLKAGYSSYGNTYQPPGSTWTAMPLDPVGLLDGYDKIYVVGIRNNTWISASSLVGAHGEDRCNWSTESIYSADLSTLGELGATENAATLSTPFQAEYTMGYSSASTFVPVFNLTKLCYGPESKIPKLTNVLNLQTDDVIQTHAGNVRLSKLLEYKPETMDKTEFIRKCCSTDVNEQFDLSNMENRIVEVDEDVNDE